MSDEPHLLSVNQSERNNELLSEFLESDGYRVSCAHTVDELDAIVEDASAVDVALIDVALIDVDGFPPEIWEQCERLRAAGTPLFVISLQPKRAEQLRRDTDADVPQIFEKPMGKRRLLELLRQIDPST